jgi:hypothetical protein
VYLRARPGIFDAVASAELVIEADRDSVWAAVGDSDDASILARRRQEHPRR